MTDTSFTLSNPKNKSSVKSTKIQPISWMSSKIGNQYCQWDQLEKASSYVFDAKNEKTSKPTKQEWLWTGESTYCICTHHVVHHCTAHDRNGSVINIHCHGSEKRCNCELFRTRSVRLSTSNYDEIVTEGLVYV